MSKEGINLSLEGVTAVLPFRDYYKGRNGKIAQMIADYLELPYFGEAHRFGRGVYQVPPKTITRETGHHYGLYDEQDFYGGCVDDLGHVSKAILHPLVANGMVPSYYSHEFARNIGQAVLPGYTVFSYEDAKAAAEMLMRQQYQVRLKKTRESDGHGQKNITSLSELHMFLAQEITIEEISMDGLTLEARVFNPITYSVGFAQLGSDRYSFIAHQKNDIGEDGRDRYMGAVVTVARGPMAELTNVSDNRTQRQSIRAAQHFYDAYAYFKPVMSRLSFDCISGDDGTGNHLCGVSDITARLGGTCPALLLAARTFKANSSIELVSAEVTLNYNPQEELPSEEKAERFIDLPSLRLTARVNKSQIARRELW